jgi:L-ascorbate metabolism protein UlaG (beta-lactamase superfamily)
VTRSSDSRPDIATPEPRLAIRFLGHATVLLELAGKRVLTDPFLRRRLGILQRHGAVPDAGELAVDVVVISHGHPDHFDRRSLAALPGRPVIVVPRGLGSALEEDRSTSGRVYELAAGESIDVDGVAIQAVSARHWVSPGAPRATPVGYLIGAAGSGESPTPTVYFAGDTGRHPGMRELAGHVDVALLPIWTWGPHLGPGHLGPRSAADALAEIGARLAIPIHWGTLYPRHLHRVWKRPLLEPARRFEAHARRAAPGTVVRILEPGQSTGVDASE